MKRLRLDTLLPAGDVCHVAIGTIVETDRPSLHTHDFMELFLILEGEGLHWINGRKIALRPGDLVLIRRKDGHGFTSEVDDRLRLLNVAFPCAWFDKFRALLPAPGGIARQLRDRMPPSAHLAAGARQALEHRGLDLMLARGPRHVDLARFCFEALAFLEKDGATPAPPPGWLAASVGAMDSAEDLRERLAFFQRRAGRSAEHFARECLRCYGAPPTEMLNRARIRRAKRRLLESDAKVIDVALDCGFNNLGYFHRTFLRLAGCTPRRWRLRNLTQAFPIR